LWILILKKGIKMDTFNSLPRLVQIILLLIPGVNWVTELIVRWSAFGHRPIIIRLIIALVVTIGGFFVGWLDAIWCLVFHHMIFAS
jgi:hypothetical protein